MLPEAAAPIKRICWWLAFIIAIFALLPWTAPTAWSHPHVFIEVRIEVELDARGIEGIWQHWTFDEYFSAWIIEEFDTDGDGKFSDEELPIFSPSPLTLCPPACWPCFFWPPAWP